MKNDDDGPESREKNPGEREKSFLQLFFYDAIRKALRAPEN